MQVLVLCICGKHFTNQAISPAPGYELKGERMCAALELGARIAVGFAIISLGCSHNVTQTWTLVSFSLPGNF